MPKEQSPGKPTTRRYTPEEKASAVRMVRALGAELGDSACCIHHRGPGSPFSSRSHAVRLRHQGVLLGIVDGRPACRRRSGGMLKVDCVGAAARSRSHGDAGVTVWPPAEATRRPGQPPRVPPQLRECGAHGGRTYRHRRGGTATRAAVASKVGGSSSLGPRVCSRL